MFIKSQSAVHSRGYEGLYIDEEISDDDKMVICEDHDGNTSVFFY